jgi:protein-S-isoprenylcysteine O-methyltransferase Ste14
MPLREEFVASGQWLFRWRSYLPVVLFVPVVVVMAVRARAGEVPVPDRGWDLFCLAVSMLGIAVRAVAIGSAPAGTSGRNTAEGQIASTVNTTGMYSIVRHPLYVGNFLNWMGVALLPRSAWLALVIALAFWLYYERIMFAEEEFLRGKFGAAYETWAARTPAFLPDPRRWQPATLPFSGRNVLKREYSGVFGIVACMTALDIVRDSVALGEPTIDPMWLSVFVATLLLYLALRTLKRRTRVLHVEGR